LALALVVTVSAPFLWARAPLPLSVEQASERFVEGVLQEIQTPELLFVPKEQAVFRVEGMPRFAVEKLASYSVGSGEKTKQKSAVQKARVLLWGILGQPGPRELAAEIKQFRENYPRTLPQFEGQYRVPANENQFKTRVFTELRNVAAVQTLLHEAWEDLQEGVAARAQVDRRWQAQADLIQSQVELQLTQLYEFQSMLGSLRKELPPFDPQQHGGWKLVPRKQLIGDTVGKRMYKGAHDRLEKIIREHPDTPYEVLARRMKEVPVGMEWQATK
jgi:hypothetical protein